MPDIPRLGDILGGSGHRRLDIDLGQRLHGRGGGCAMDSFRKIGEQLEHAENSIGYFERGKMQLGTQASDHLLKGESADQVAKLKRTVEDMRRLIADIARDSGR